MPLDAFRPQGQTLLLASTQASATTVQPSSDGSIQGLMIQNLSTSDAYVCISSTGIAASVPTTATPSTGHMPVMQRMVYIVTTPPNCYVSAITSAGQANLALTPGFGQ